MGVLLFRKSKLNCSRSTAKVYGMIIINYTENRWQIWHHLLSNKLHYLFQNRSPQQYIDCNPAEKDPKPKTSIMEMKFIFKMTKKPYRISIDFFNFQLSIPLYNLLFQANTIKFQPSVSFLFLSSFFLEMRHNFIMSACFPSLTCYVLARKKTRNLAAEWHKCLPQCCKCQSFHQKKMLI